MYARNTEHNAMYRLCKAKAWAEKLGAQWIIAKIADNLSAYVYKFLYALAWKVEQLKGYFCIWMRKNAHFYA